MESPRPQVCRVLDAEHETPVTAGDSVILRVILRELQPLVVQLAAERDVEAREVVLGRELVALARALRALRGGLDVRRRRPARAARDARGDAREQVRRHLLRDPVEERGELLAAVVLAVLRGRGREHVAVARGGGASRGVLRLLCSAAAPPRAEPARPVPLGQARRRDREADGLEARAVELEVEPARAANLLVVRALDRPEELVPSARSARSRARHSPTPRRPPRAGRPRRRRPRARASRRRRARAWAARAGARRSRSARGPRRRSSARAGRPGCPR
jgi:hypothetical protein